MSRSQEHRRGFTLIELMVVLALASILLATSVVMFSALFKSQRQFSLRERQRRELTRIDASLRSDTHAASSAKVDDAGRCELKNGAGEVWSYHRDEDTLVRVRSKEGKVVQRESFRLQPGTKVEFRVVPERKRNRLHVRIEPPAVTGAAIAPATPYDGQFLIGGIAPQSAQESP